MGSSGPLEETKEWEPVLRPVDGVTIVRFQTSEAYRRTVQYIDQTERSDRTEIYVRDKKAFYGRYCNFFGSFTSQGHLEHIYVPDKNKKKMVPLERSYDVLDLFERHIVSREEGEEIGYTNESGGTSKPRKSLEAHRHRKTTVMVKTPFWEELYRLYQWFYYMRPPRKADTSYIFQGEKGLGRTMAQPRGAQPTALHVLRQGIAPWRGLDGYREETKLLKAFEERRVAAVVKAGVGRKTKEARLIGVPMLIDFFESIGAPVAVMKKELILVDAKVVVDDALGEEVDRVRAGIKKF